MDAPWQNFSQRMATRVAHSIQIHGGNGYSREYPSNATIRDAASPKSMKAPANPAPSHFLLGITFVMFSA